MAEYRVDVNHVYYNDALGTFEAGLILGNSVLQYGDRFMAEAAQVGDLLAANGVTLVSN
jgi:hypothetical protein